MRKFSDDDEGYTCWLQEHPDGFVVNTYRRPSQSYLILPGGVSAYQHTHKRIPKVDSRLPQSLRSEP